MDLLIANIARYNISLTPGETDVLRSLVTQKRYRKHQFILQEGEVATRETFVLTGLTRTYETDADGATHVLFFGPEDWWVGDLYSFLTTTPSKYNVDCLEDTEVLQVTREALEEMYKRIPAMNEYFRILFQNAFIAAMNRIGNTLSKSAAQRYLDFLQRYPGLDQRVPNHLIASYIGITPQSLSRVRRELAQRGQ